MSNEIYGSLMARVVHEEHTASKNKDDIEVHLWDKHSSRDRPAIVLENLTEVKALREYLDWLITKHPNYFKERN